MAATWKSACAITAPASTSARGRRCSSDSAGGGPLVGWRDMVSVCTSASASSKRMEVRCSRGDWTTAPSSDSPCRRVSAGATELIPLPLHWTTQRDPVSDAPDVLELEIRSDRGELLPDPPYRTAEGIEGRHAAVRP